MTNFEPTEHTTDGESTRRAALWVWALGALELVASGVMTIACMALASMPVEKILTMVQTAEERAMLEQIHPMMSVAASLFFVLGVLPGVALIVLGIGVRDGRRDAIVASLTIVGTQMMLLGLVLIANVLGAMIQGEPSAMISNLIVLGGIMLAQWACVRTLWHARAAGSSPWDIDSDPWPHQTLPEQTR